jgi:uncharacterized membrane protein YkvI
LSGKDPTEFNSADPLRLWIIQVGAWLDQIHQKWGVNAHICALLGIIICTASLLSLGLRKMRQPKVIAEVLGGIILGVLAASPRLNASS